MVGFPKSHENMAEPSVCVTPAAAQDCSHCDVVMLPSGPVQTLSYEVLSRFKSELHSLQYTQINSKKYANFKNANRNISTPHPLCQAPSGKLFSKEPRFHLLGRQGRVFFLYKNTVPQVCLAIQQDSRRTGKRVKQGSREERKNCQIKTPRKQISQYQDLQKKTSVSIMTREGQDTQALQ